ncbi:restriction endonuclease subunit S [Deinococcus sp.]|uniref:restriction endonuclease subunit S n=1 Tax=Deinococcus sp. TaxID=47478 RepID=UPI0025BF9D62|nr:restriction endonuclease subunit S [Deinococcus sp.]
MEKVEELFSKLDAGVAELRRTQGLLKRYRQSLLHAAVTGELSREWRTQTQNISSWLEATVEECATTIFDGPFGSNLKSSDYTSVGIRVIRLENIGHLQFISEKKTYISEEKYQNLKRYTIQSKDIIFSSFIDKSIRVCIYETKFGKSINKADCFAIRCNTSRVIPEYLVFALSDQDTYIEFSKNIHGATRPRINLSQLRSFVFKLPPLPEQEFIVAEVERRLSVLDNLEATVAAELKRAESTRQSILHRAFTGQLVPQDPTDEPASTLLDRIQGERIAAGAAAIRAGAGSGRRGRPRKAQGSDPLLTEKE